LAVFLEEESCGGLREVCVPTSESLDLIVIGCGPAGEKAGAQAAYFGKRVAVIERAPDVGGSCINTGTVPSKTLRESALYFSGLTQRGLYGIDYSLKENLTIQDFMHHERAHCCGHCSKRSAPSSWRGDSHRYRLEATPPRGDRI
jgi:pyruvate/2-oxoglutarate dehydrogenase complex dihydrolipoamide dehydrogenase (E3) component